jgi:hypothetical protein
MNEAEPECWEQDHAIEVNASADAIWALLRDRSGWKKWNDGIEKIEFDGPFEAGQRFVMTPPGSAPLVCRLLEVRENAGFVDETRVGDLRVFVDHRIEVLDAQRCRVVFSMQAFGRGCEEIGPAAAADFPAVLKNLALLAESAECIRC